MTLGGATAWALAATLSAAPASREASPTSLERLAALVAAQAQEHASEPPVGLYVRGASAELARAFGTLLAAELERRRLAPVPLEALGPVEAERAARQGGLRSLVRLTLSLESGALVARGDLLGTWVNFWSGSAPTRPAAPAAALEASLDADAQALALATTGPLPPDKRRGDFKLVGAPFAKLALPPAALAAGDLDGDGRAEVAVLTDDEVIVYSGLGRVLARRDHRGLPSSPTPCREPFGALAVLAKPARLAYFSARRARGELLALDRGTLRPVGTSEEAPIARVGEIELGGAFVPGENVFAPALALGASRWTLEGPFSALSAHAAAGGNAFLVVMPDGSATLSVGTPAATPGKLSGLGAGSALADLDGDGRPEIVTSSGQYAPAPEELRVLLLNGNTPGPEVWRSADLPKGARVLQVAAADLDGDGDDELLVGLWLPDGTGELDVYRRAP